MKPLLLFLFLFSTSASAEELTDLEVACWHESVDQGAFQCQFVLVMGKRSSDQSFLVPVLAAPDQGGPKTWGQADLACKSLGFHHAVHFELELPKNEKFQVTLNPSGTGYLAPVVASFVQHVSCE